MTGPRSVLSQRSFKVDATFKWGLMAVVLPDIAHSSECGTLNDPSFKTPDTHCNSIDTHVDLLVDTYLETVTQYTSTASDKLFNQRCITLGRYLDSPELYPHFKAAIQAASKMTEAVARRSSAPLNPLTAISILVNCLNREFEKAGLVPQLMDAVEAALSDKSSTSSPRGWVRDVMSRAVSFMGSKLAERAKRMFPTVLLCGLLSALPLASGAPTERGDEALETDFIEAEDESLLDRVTVKVLQNPYILAGGVVLDAAVVYAFIHYIRKTCEYPDSRTRFNFFPLRRQPRQGPLYPPLLKEVKGPYDDGQSLVSSTKGPDQFVLWDDLLVAKWGTRWYPLPNDFTWDKIGDVIKSKPLMLKDGRPVVSDDEVTEVPYTVYEHTAMSSDGTCPLWTKLPEGYHKAEGVRLTSDGQALLKFEDVWYKVDGLIHHIGNNLFEGPCFYKDEEGRVEMDGFARYEVPLETETEASLNEASGLAVGDTVSETSTSEYEEYQPTWSALYESTESVKDLLDTIKSLSPGQSDGIPRRDQTISPQASAFSSWEGNLAASEEQVERVSTNGEDDLTTPDEVYEVIKTPPSNNESWRPASTECTTTDVNHNIDETHLTKIGLALNNVLNDPNVRDVFRLALQDWEDKLLASEKRMKLLSDEKMKGLNKLGNARRIRRA
eukprot:Blabericola_migrator_1__2419@NODE_1680_length_4016_cov_91_950114_g1090_i0_p1_GENE_NODE_1680_length_4016_cov_91_950114_g1090_i0NODE_1680_length_4016_cov_91_950114_g1090_i0_p1_ORF_typecomplete_len667_score92_85DUF5388/PF17363_2/4_1e02DUF5388/PF17363_2/3_1_NODE_1680_length_4016_cov_91_950114_g1090_i08992899